MEKVIVPFVSLLFLCASSAFAMAEASGPGFLLPGGQRGIQRNEDAVPAVFDMAKGTRVGFGNILTASWTAEEEPLCGGVTDRTDYSAPKVIKSKEITAFNATFWVADEDASRGGRWKLHAVKESSGRLVIKVEGSLQAQEQADATLLIAIQEIIDRFELAKLNGRDRVTAGLPPSFSPTRLRVEYASGEHLYFQMNGDPEAGWTREITNLFLSVLPER